MCHSWKNEKDKNVQMTMTLVPSCPISFYEKAKIIKYNKTHSYQRSIPL